VDVTQTVESSCGSEYAEWLPARLERELASSLRRFAVPFADFQRDVLPRFAAAAGTNSSIDQHALCDMLLAYACSRGNRNALEAFDLEVGRDFDAAAAKLRLDAARCSDARQQLWQRLFVGDAKPPKILEYQGKGRLRHWFRVLASRFLLNEIRKGNRDRLVFDSEHGELSVATERDPELALLEQTYRQQFRAALYDSLRALQPDQRNALRCHYIHAMSVDRMADVFGVHRATAARRVVHARQELLRLTCDYLRRALGADTEELNSVIRRAQAQSSLSVARLLEQDTPMEKDGNA
jgi:RNA polymerase sigma-70 factor, ECF subfamily